MYYIYIWAAIREQVDGMLVHELPSTMYRINGYELTNIVVHLHCYAVLRCVCFFPQFMSVRRHMTTTMAKASCSRLGRFYLFKSSFIHSIFSRFSLQLLFAH